MASLQTRLLIAVSCVSAAAIAGVAFWARQTTRVEFERFTMEQRIESRNADSALERLARVVDGRCCETIEADVQKAGLGQDRIVLVFDENGKLIVAIGRDLVRPRTTAALEDGQIRIHAEMEDVDSGAHTVLSLNGTSQMFTTRTATGATVTLASFPWRRNDRMSAGGRFLGSIDRGLVFAAAACVALGLAVTWLIARRLIHPLIELRDATQALAGGRLDRRVTVSGRDEVAELGRSFNRMAAELEKQHEVRRDLMRDVAHELRTPLTALRCRIETVLDGLARDPRPALANANDEIAHLSRLIGDLEEIAQAEAGELRLDARDVRVREACGAAIRSASLDNDPRIRTDIADDPVLRGDVARVRQILTNLLTNAARHTPGDGAITIRSSRRGSEIAIEIHNTGSRLTPEELARVFDRFYRADPSRQRATGGSGLGLAIVKHLAEAQGGRVEAASDESGTSFTVVLPAA